MNNSFRTTTLLLVLLFSINKIPQKESVPAASANYFHNSGFLVINSNQKIHSPANTANDPLTTLESGQNPVLLEGRQADLRKKKVFGAAQFVCALPIEPGTFTTVCREPEDAEAAVKKLKKQGCSEIWLKTVSNKAVLNAIVKSAREHDLRINV